MDHGERTERLANAAMRDEAAFEELVARVRGRLALWISLRLGPALRARVAPEDVEQESLLEAHRSLERFVPDGPGSFQRWLFAVAENRVRDMHKFHTRAKRDLARDRPVNAVPLDLLAGPGTTPSARAHRGELLEQVSRRLERLPAAEREIVVLRTVEDCSFAEIAERVGKAKTTVFDLYARGLRSLRNGRAD